MLMPFVGRTYELRRLARLLNEGRNVVLTGVYGSGRTTLLRQFAGKERGRQFVFWDSRNSQRALRITVEKLYAVRTVHNRPRDRTPLVVVIDDVVQVTTQRLRSLRELVRAHRCQIIVIVEGSVPRGDVTRLRVALDAAHLVGLGPLSRSATERYFSHAAREHNLGWNLEEIRSTARSTHGHPLIMRATLEAAVAANRRAQVVSHGTPSSSAPSSFFRETLPRRWSPPLTVWRRARLMTPAEPVRQELCLEAIMTTLCPACWRVVSNDARVCSHCGADISQLHERDFRDKLLGALSHPDRDTVIRAAVALAARHDPAASQAIETAMRRFPNEPHVLAGLLNALMFVADDEARRIALDALGHRSFIVRRAAAQVLEHIDRIESKSSCTRREP